MIFCERTSFVFKEGRVLSLGESAIVNAPYFT